VYPEEDLADMDVKGIRHLVRCSSKLPQRHPWGQGEPLRGWALRNWKCALPCCERQKSPGPKQVCCRRARLTGGGAFAMGASLMASRVAFSPQINNPAR